MGIITDAFGKLFSVIWSVISWIGTTIWNGIKWVGDVIWDAIKWIGGVLWDVIKWIGDLLAKLFQNLIDLLISFFEVIYALIDGLLYLLYNIGLIAVKIFLIFFEMAKLLVSLIVGLFKTLASLNYTQRTSSNTGYSEILGNIFEAAQPLQINVIAYILMFILWIGTAVAAMKLLSSVRVGGD
ncbi:hypothetical protein [Litchfieldia salsa]|uniref:Uncharacterized protein n=1 Tax=Litchfieldia salsa TaxID=930152 RepID=A0A1H0VNP4_9BACI|nr:hypothetical protein [Litchfieldia salsa]SDP80060.1 hypothetical protein SAMN05216565_107105 [Litchfieldia salsa]